MNFLKLSVLIFTVAFFTSCDSKKEVKPQKKQASDSFTISGEIKGLGNTNLIFRMPDDTKPKKFRWDTIYVKNDKFSYTDKITKFKFLKFWINNESIKKKTPDGGVYPVLSSNLVLFAYPGADIKVEGELTDFVNAYPSGDKANNDLAKLLKEIYPLLSESGNLMTKRAFEKDEAIKKELTNSIALIDDKIHKIKKSFIENNLDSEAGVWLLSDMFKRKQIKENEAIALFNKMNSKLNKNPNFIDLEERIKGISATKEGNIVPEIKTTSTIDGKEFDLKSYRGKYVLIDFWGTWCAPCVKEMPHVKKFLEKYPNQLEVVGVNSGDTKKRMVDFLEKNNFNWQQVMSLKGASKDNFVSKFNVTSFPTLFVIDPEGKILKKFVGGGNEVFEYLESAFKKNGI